ncbi:hypothetical protein Vadar_034441 [Vaccinium darrowii]|uniref:Uncharacterized protein n=1 Tax=Vaccinium darrowii TaxID=229202 RepID=A0ACB7X6D9_9ERIC|nr:hypothetical protein Vadar_034441 [Vaccinium darrowii]
MMTKYHCLAFLVATLVLLSSCINAQTVQKSQTDALLKWKQSLVNQSILNSWVIQQNANLSTPIPCNWFGITCNNEGQVIGIKLNNTGLNGTLEHLDYSSFPQLLRLDLNTNRLTGTIPFTIGILTKLQLLDLSTNSLTGTLPLNLSKVVELDVSRNMITGGLDSRLFPNGTKGTKTGLVSLKWFLIQDTYLSGRIPSELGNSKELKLIAFDGCHFFGPIPTSLGNLSELTALRLAENQLSGQIPSNIATQRLTDLRLFKNQLSGSVPRDLGNLSSLVTLHLAENNFTGQLPPQVCKGGNIVNFSAAYNMFSGPVPTSLRNCTTLFRVRL